MTNTVNTLTTETVEIENLATVPARTRKAKTTNVARTRTPRVVVPVNELGVVDQVSIAFAKNNLFATLCGLVLGASVPVTVFRTAHFGVQQNPWLWVLVVGGLIYSAITVYKWGYVALTSRKDSNAVQVMKALGFVVLVEGGMTFSPDHYVVYLMLFLLISINAIASACNLIADKKEARKSLVSVIQ